MSRNVSITYELNPPADTAADGLSAKKVHDIPINAPADNLQAYYAAVREAIAAGKDVVGEELTVWRDAVGNREQSKEAKAPKKVDDEDDDEEEEMEE